MMPTKVFIADDHDTVTDGLLAILRPLSDINVVGRARDGAELLRMLSHKPVDVLMLDLAMPVQGGLDVLPRLRDAHPQLRIVVLSSERSFDHIDSALRAGAHSYLTKDADKTDIIAAIRATAEGRSYYNATVTEAILEGKRTAAGVTTEVLLTQRERTVVCLILKELTSREIGARLSISPLTVERHRRNIFGKLEIKNVVGLVKYAMRQGLLREDCMSYEGE